MFRRLLPLVLVAACGKPATPSANGGSGVPTLAGFWQTEGYGLQAEFTTDSLLKLSEVTAISCVQSVMAKSLASPPAGAVAAYRLIDAPLTFLILPDSAPGKIRIHFNGAASDMIARRIDAPLAVCGRPTPNTPIANFDAFAATWSEHYPFFADKKTDWGAVVAANRPKITDQTKPESLFAVLKGMIEPLQDAHSGIMAKDLSLRYNGSRAGADHLDRSEFDRAYALVDKHLTGPLHRFCEGKIEFGLIGKDVGYLRIRAFSGYHADGSFESGLAALEAALDTIFKDASGWRGLLIDVRINGGGADPLGLAIAGRLTDSPYVAYAKQALLDPREPAKWTPEQVSLVKPTSRPGFRGPVVELIGLHSVSAAETFTQALLGRRPKVVRVGENTQGVFSDVLVRTLPNGWRFGLPNERFVTDGKSYDGPGIPPDSAVPVFPPADLKSGRDGSLEAALKLIPAKR